MEKQPLLSIFEKYYLNGIVEKVKLIIKDKTITTHFLAPNKDLVGCVHSENFECDDVELGIYDTSQLLKLINITNQFITFDVLKEHNIATKLLIADNEYNLEYILADTTMIPNVPIVDEPIYDVEAELDLEFINKFIKAKKALDAPLFSITATYNDNKAKILRFTLGGTAGYTNKVIFDVPAQYEGIFNKVLQFDINYLKEILDNNKDLEKGKLRLFNEGLMRIDFNSLASQCHYILVAKEDV